MHERRREDVGAALRRLVRQRAQGQCEYCYMPESETLYPHEPDHIIAVKHGGPTTSENLAHTCFDCNRAKGSDIASLDPVTGALTPLFNPRQQQWRDHFKFNGPVIEPLTAVGRVTVLILRLNTTMRIAVRESLMAEGRYPHS